MNQLVCVRHGETEWSKSGRHTSVTDLPLLPEGVERARYLTKPLSNFDFALVVSSPLLRARQTANLAGFADPVIDPDLLEWRYGDDEGITTPVILDQRPGWDMWRDGFPNGESPAEVVARVDRFIERVMDAPGDVLAFAHGHLLRVLAVRWLELDIISGSRFELDPGTISLLAWRHGLRTVRFWNAAPDEAY